MSPLLARLLRAVISPNAAACVSACVLLSPEAHGAAAYFNNVFPQREPGSSSGWKTVNAFPNLSFVDPLWITELPGGSGEMLVLVKGGQIWRFPNDPAVTTTQRSLVVDIADRLQISSEMGLLRIAFHPQFGQAGSTHANDVFLCYSHRPPGTESSDYHNMWRISRFQWQPGTKTIDPASEEILIQQYDPDGWHNGGILAFDNDGFLLISAGDGGSRDDFHNLSQKLDFGLFAGVFRIDVDNNPNRSHPIRRQPLDLAARKPAGYPASFTQGYGIPNDNPWQDPGGAVLEEYYAQGLRSPHSGHYDPVEGELWVGDVGQDTNSVEELNLVRRGGNYGWRSFNGIGISTPAVHSYTRDVGRSIIGGPRYRGAKWAAEFGGKVLIGDNISATLFTVTRPAAPAVPVRTQILAGLGGTLYSGLANICTDSAGEIYLPMLNGIGKDGGRILKLEKSGTTPQPPQFLSQTGLFTDLATLAPHSLLIPYTVANPLWSDGAEKKRWIVRHPGTSLDRLSIKADGSWNFPPGSVLVKHFELPVDERNPEITRKLETRVMVKAADGGKYGLTYKWNAAGTDAELLEDGADEEIPVTLADGSAATKRWTYPSRSDCRTCHTEQTGFAIGFRTHQLNLDIPHPETGEPVNQLDYMRSGNNFFSGPSTLWQGRLRSASLDDESMPLEHRVRSYLDSNCSHCHRPDTGTAFFDARLETPLAWQNLIDAPMTGHFNLGPDGRYIKPGNAFLSALHVRGASTVPGEAMPPLGRHEVDQQAMDLLRDYINSLGSGDFISQPTPQARYFRLVATGVTSASVSELSLLDGRGFPIPSSNLSIGAVSGGAGSAGGAIDGDVSTSWWSGTGTGPHFITLDLRSIREIGGYIYQPSSGSNRIRDFEIQLSTNGTDWTTVQSGVFPNNATPVTYRGFLKPGAPRASFSAPAAARGTFAVNLILDREVTDLTLSDFVLTAGTASNLRGQGYFYTVDITPPEQNSSSQITVTLPENAVSPTGFGNKEASIIIEALDNMPPVATISQSTPSTTGRYSVEITFNEPVTGLEAGDITLTNGKVISLTGSGTNYVLTVQEDRPTYTTVTIAANSCHDLSGLGNDVIWLARTGGPVWIEVRKPLQHAISQQGFNPVYSGDIELYGVRVEDDRNGDISASEDYKMAFRFNLPHDGVYIFQAETRADSTDSNSFHIGIDGGPPALWNTNRNPGEIGSQEFHLGVAGESDEYHYHLTAGEHTVEIYGREAGTIFRWPELVPLNPLPQWWSGDYEFHQNSYGEYLHFTRPVTGLEISDFVVHGATITYLGSVDGSDRDYHISLRPDAREISISLPADRAHFGELGNLASLEWRYRYISPYEVWARNLGIAWGPEHHLQDDDRDGIPLLLEYAFDLDPKHASMQGRHNTSLPKMVLGENNGAPQLMLEYDRRWDTGGIRYIPQFSGDGITWEDATNPEVILQQESQWERIGVSDHGSGSRRFGRVKVEAME